MLAGADEYQAQAQPDRYAELDMPAALPAATLGGERDQRVSGGQVVQVDEGVVRARYKSPHPRSPQAPPQPRER